MSIHLKQIFLQSYVDIREKDLIDISWRLDRPVYRPISLKSANCLRSRMRLLGGNGLQK